MEKHNRPPKTIRALIQVSQAWLEARGVDSARLDAELLLAHALGETRLRLYLDLDRPILPDERERFRPLLARRGRREPVAYILGHKEFFGIDFEVTPEVLVPRPDTESVVEEALQRLPPGCEGTVVDVCTGSACIGIVLANERPGLRVIATDLSPTALAVAARNVARHGLTDRVTLREGDLLAPVAEERELLAIVGNPPYIMATEAPSLMPEVKAHEPALALFGEGESGLGHHRRILAKAAQYLAPGGFVLLESGHAQAEGLRALSAPGLGAPDLIYDLGGRVRGGLWRRAVLPSSGG